VNPVRISCAEVARQLGVSLRKAQSLCQNGDIVAIRVGRCWRVRQEHLDAWITEREKWQTTSIKEAVFGMEGSGLQGRNTDAAYERLMRGRQEMQSSGGGNR
jgi:hypothetical protein